MGNTYFICENYYCQSITYKPEWFSESNWNIEYSYSNTEKIQKPYSIQKGIFRIENIHMLTNVKLFLCKKLQIDVEEIKNISIPI